MLSKYQKVISSVLVSQVFLNFFPVYSDSTWTGNSSSDMNSGFNWNPTSVPSGSTAIFNGNGANSPLSRRDAGIDFDTMQFTSSTDVSVITGLSATGTSGITATPGTVANFEIYETNYPIYTEARMQVTSGPAGDGGGTVDYQLQGYGQLYAYSGSTGTTVVNATMTSGNNYLEITGTGNCLFNEVSSDDVSDEIHIGDGANFVTRNSSNNTFEGVISGNGSFTKSGSGSLTLSNDNTFLGGTSVSQGTLILNGSLASDITVGASGTLQGSGTVNGDLTLSGTIAPGNSIGTLTVDNYTSTSSSVYDCEINSAGGADKIVATGTMTLDGTLNLIPLDQNFSSAQTYSILQSTGALTGTFSNIQSTVPSLKYLTYTAGGVALTYLPVSSMGLSGNAAAAANSYGLLSGTDVADVSEVLLSLSGPEQQAAFNVIQPSQLSAQTWTQLSNTLLIRSSYSNHLREFSLRKSCSDLFRSDVWIDAIGQWEHQSAKQNQFGYHDWTAGTSLGLGTSFKQWVFGGAASYTYSQVHWNQSVGSSHINSYYGGLYGGWSDDVGYVILSALGAYNDYHSTRNISFSTINRQARASHHGWEGLAGIEGGAYFKVKNFKMGPFGRIDYIYLWQNKYQETGASSLNLHLDSRHDQLIQSQAGVAFTGNYECDPEKKSGTFMPRLELSYINQTPIAKANYAASYQDSSYTFNVSGWNFERNLGAVGASLSYTTASERVGVSLQYDGQFGSGYQNQQGSLMCNIKY